MLFRSIRKGVEIRNELIGKAEKREIILPDADELLNAPNLPVGVLAEENEDLRSLKQLVLYGLKGAAAYAEHALNLGFEDVSIYEGIETALSEISRHDIVADELVSLVLTVGQLGVKTMGLLDNANTSTYGNPEITKVNIGVRNKLGRAHV